MHQYLVNYINFAYGWKSTPETRQVLAINEDDARRRFQIESPSMMIRIQSITRAS